VDHHKNECRILLCIYKKCTINFKSRYLLLHRDYDSEWKSVRNYDCKYKNNFKNAHTIFMLKLCKYSTSDF